MMRRWLNMLFRSKWVVISCVILLFLIGGVLAYKMFHNQKQSKAAVTISDGIVLDVDIDDDFLEAFEREKGISIEGNEKKIDIDRDEFKYFILDLRKSEKNWLGKHEWFSLDDYSINKDWFTLDETEPVKMHQVGPEKSVENFERSHQYYFFAWTSEVNSFQERTMTAINIARLQLSTKGENVRQVYFGIDEALTIEYDPKKNKVRLNEDGKGLILSNIETTVVIDEKEIFYGEEFSGRVRDKKGLKSQYFYFANKYLGDYEFQLMKYRSEDEALQELKKSRGPFVDYSIVKPDDYVLHEVEMYPETKSATVEVKFDIE